MKRTLLLVLLSLLFVLCISASAAADSPGLSSAEGMTALGYSGYLTNAAGIPVDSLVDMRFRLYTGSVSGTVLYDSGVIPSIPVDDGIFDVTLQVDSAVFNGQELWLSTQVDGETLLPRQPVSSVPYAAGLMPGANIQAMNGTGLAVASDSGTGLSGVSSTGVGVVGQSLGSGEPTSYGGTFSSASTAGVCGVSAAEASEANHHASGVYAFSHNGPGLMAETANTDNLPAVLAVVDDGIGLKAKAVSGYGLYGLCSTGCAVYGENSGGQNGQGYGGFFSSTTGVGVRGETFATTDSAFGVSGESQHGTGVLGKGGSLSFTPSTERVGVQGIGEDAGVRGSSVSGIGIAAESVNANGLEATSKASYGAYLASENSYGAYISSNSYRGMYVSGGTGSWAAYIDSNAPSFPGLFVNGTTTLTGDLEVMGDLAVAGSKSGYLVDLAQNVDNIPLKKGDVVVIVGVEEPAMGDIPLLLVAACRDEASTSVVGVVDERMLVVDTETGCHVTRDREGGAIAPGTYLNVVTSGTFGWISVDGSYGPVEPGDLLISSETVGCARISSAPGVGTVIGKSLGTLVEGVGQVPVMVTLD